MSRLPDRDIFEETDGKEPSYRRGRRIKELRAGARSIESKAIR
jgi:hypothetical protein